jgi:hypothetical protein
VLGNAGAVLGNAGLVLGSVVVLRRAWVSRQLPVGWA